jgi:endonuclease V-like protein UPF0215 family
MTSARPHSLGIDDGPFEKFRSTTVPIVGVMMEGPDLVEGVARTEFAVDGEDATGFLANWVEGLRFRPALQGIFLGGITIAGLGVVDLVALAERMGLPVLAVNRRDPTNHRLHDALEAAGLAHRMSLVKRAPAARRVDDHLFVAAAGIEPEEAVSWVRATRLKSEIPEPLRLAHLIARAMVTGESRGRP